MITIQEREYNLLKEYASQKLREEFDAAKEWFEQACIAERTLRLGLFELHEEMKADMKVGVTEQIQDDRDFKESTGWPKF